MFAMGFWAIVIDRDDDWLEVIGMVLGASVVVALLGAAVFTVGNGISNVASGRDWSYKDVPLVSIRDGSGVNGSYVLGTGGTSSTGRYVFYYQDGSAKRLVNINAEKVKLFEDSDRPYAVKAINCRMSVEWLAYTMACPDDHFTEIHVPAGSVQTRIDLNLNSN